MALYDYEFNKTATYSLLAASVIFIVFKIFQQIHLNFVAEAHVRNSGLITLCHSLSLQIKQILVILKIDSKSLVTSSTHILHLAKNFEEFFPELTNLKRFNGF